MRYQVRGSETKVGLPPNGTTRGLDKQGAVRRRAAHVRVI
jgi:hypothetical protein